MRRWNLSIIVIVVAMITITGAFYLGGRAFSAKRGAAVQQVDLVATYGAFDVKKITVKQFEDSKNEHVVYGVYLRNDEVPTPLLRVSNLPDKEQVTTLVKQWIEGEAHVRDVLTTERDTVSNDQAKDNVTKELERRAARVARVTAQLPTLEK